MSYPSRMEIIAWSLISLLPIVAQLSEWIAYPFIYICSAMPIMRFGRSWKNVVGAIFFLIIFCVIGLIIGNFFFKVDFRYPHPVTFQFLPIPAILYNPAPPRWMHNANATILVASLFYSIPINLIVHYFMGKREFYKLIKSSIKGGLVFLILLYTHLLVVPQSGWKLTTSFEIDSEIKFIVKAVAGCFTLLFIFIGFYLFIYNEYFVLDNEGQSQYCSA